MEEKASQKPNLLTQNITLTFSVVSDYNLSTVTEITLDSHLRDTGQQKPHISTTQSITIKTRYITYACLWIKSKK